MYSIGESFTYEIEDEEKVFNVVGDVVIRGKEYVIGEDDMNICYVFWYNDADEEIVYIDDADEAEKLLDEWQEEYYGTIDEVGLWEEEYDENDEEEEENQEDYYIEGDSLDDDDGDGLGYYIDDLGEDNDEDDDNY